MMRLLITAVFAIAACVVNARMVTAEGDPHPLKPADTSSPRATLKSFSENMNAMYALIKEHGRAADASRLAMFKMRAIRCLDLSEIDPSAAEDLGEKRAVLLTEILDRIELPPLDAIPDADEASQKMMTRWRIPDTEIAIVQIRDGPREGEYLFSAGTVSRIPEFYDRAKNLPYRQGTVLEKAYEQLFTLAPPIPAEINPLEPADTDSPQATLRTFLDNLNAVYRSFKDHGMNSPAVAERQDSVGRAIRCLNLSEVPPSMADETGKETAVLLMEVFDRIEMPVIEVVPGTKQVEEAKLASWTVPNTEITIARVAQGPREGEFLFTPETVDRTRKFYEQVKHLPYKDGTMLQDAHHVYLQSPGRMVPISWVLGMPVWLKEIVLGQPVWKWIAVVAVLFVLLVGLVLSIRFGSRKRQDDLRAPFWKRAVLPISGICLALLTDGAISQLNVLKEIVFLTSISTSVIFSLSVLWLIILVSNAVAERIVASPHINSSALSRLRIRVTCVVSSGNLRRNLHCQP